MHTYRLHCELLVPLDVAETFQAFEEPRNLAKITPPWMRMEMLTAAPKMAKGLEIDYRIRWMGLALQWKTLITEYEPPFLFVDEALRSPYRLWRHRHSFRPGPDGTVVIDDVTYALPFGPLGRLAHAVAVRRQLVEIFAYRQEKMADILGAAGRTIQEPSVAVAR
jgi:ligand-binding SRPBCC domain-containing protein